MGGRDPRRRLDLGVRRPGPGEGDVLADGRREQEALLEHDVDRRAQRAPASGRARRRRRGGPCPTSGRRSGRSGTPASTCPSPTPRRCRCARPGGSAANVVHRRRPPGVAEADVVEVDARHGRRPRPRARRVRHPGLQVEQLEDALGAGARLLGRREQAGDEADRRDELHHVAGEGEEDAERDVSVSASQPPSARTPSWANVGSACSVGEYLQFNRAVSLMPTLGRDQTCRPCAGT